MVAPKKEPSFVEFVALSALAISMVALAIDAMLPVISEVGRDFSVDSNQSTLIILSIFVGMAMGQLIFGPISDSVGRRKPILYGFLVFSVGSVVSMLASEYWVLLIGRVLQGLGASGPRTVVVAVVRDRYEGDAMARIMSMVMAVFISVPAIAPALGQVIASQWGWRAIFAFFVLVAVVAGVWFAWRQPETLNLENRRPFGARPMWQAFKLVLAQRSAVAYTFSNGFVVAAFVGMLSSIQPIFQELYGLGNMFPVYFASTAAAIGVASLVNAGIVVRVGLVRLTNLAVFMVAALSLLFLPLAIWGDGRPSIYIFLPYLWVVFYCYGHIFGNLNALAMRALGAVAGIGSAFVASASILVALPIAWTIGNAYNDSVLPVTIAYAVCAVLTLMTNKMAEHIPKKAEVIR